MASFKELPYVAKIGIVALVIILLAVATYFFELEPIAKTNQADALTLKSKQAEIAQLTPYKAKLAELNKETADLKAKMEAQNKLVPEEKDVPSLINLVESQSTAAHVEIRRYTPRDTTTKDYYVEVPVEIDVDGPYYAVTNFYDRLKNMERIVNVSNLTMGALKGGKVPAKKSYKWNPNETVAASCLLTTFYSTSKSASPPAVAKK